MIHEQEPTFFGTSRITMTSMEAVKSMKDELISEGIQDQVVVLKGWSGDGLSYRQPYALNHPNKNGLDQLISSTKDQGNSIYLEQDYLVSSELSSRVSFNRDVARNYSKLNMSYPLNRLDNQPIDEYYLYPEVAQSMFDRDLGAINALGVSGLALPHLGKTLFSYYDDARFSRSETLEIVTDMADELPGSAMHRPSAYMFPYLNHYLDMPITNSQLDLFTDLVPLVPMVLKGYIPTFTPYLNFNALGKERLLQMIDFGVNPSYLLTQQPSSTLRFTYSNRYFTTAYDDFKSDITSVYPYIAGALDHVSGARVTHRTMLATGVSFVSYDNGISLLINYRSSPYTHEQSTVEGLDYEVILP